LTLADVKLPIEVVTMATAEVMASIFEAVGDTVAISPTSVDRALPPILEVPPAIKPGHTPLILCYFLVQRDAFQLEKLLAKEYLGEDEYTFGKCEFHCFTAQELPLPKGRPLALHSHPKQRQLFQTLFSKCTGVIVSSGNETVWESVCRGVPVLTMPTTGHGEQLLNARVHSRNFPQLVRAVEAKGLIEPGGKLTKADLLWVVQYEQSDASRAESKNLREKVAALESTVVKKQVSYLLPPGCDVPGADLPADGAAALAAPPGGQMRALAIGVVMYAAGLATAWGMYML